MHDDRIGGTGPSCQTADWNLGETPVGQWSHIAAVYEQGGESYAFLNGVKSSVHAVSHNDNPENLVLGSPYPTGHLANAHVASARVYADVLSDAEIVAHSQSQPGSFCSAQ